MRNSYFSHVGTPSGKYQPRLRGIKVASLHTGTLGNGMAKGNELAGTNQLARKGKRSPAQFTGCISELSCDALDCHVQDDALKNYVEVYRKSHAYLDSGDSVAEHDYTLIVAETEEHGLLGLLGDDIEQSVRTHVHFSDEEIEQLGYLGWIQH